MVNLTTKLIIPETEQNDVRNMEARGPRAFTQLFEERILEDKKPWEKISQVEMLTVRSVCKILKRKTRTEEITLKTTNLLLAHLLSFPNLQNASTWKM